jgi:hypothetical protein
VIARIMADTPLLATDGVRGWTLGRYLADRVVAERPLTVGASCSTTLR